MHSRLIAHVWYNALQGFPFSFKGAEQCCMILGLICNSLVWQIRCGDLLLVDASILWGFYQPSKAVHNSLFETSDIKARISPPVLATSSLKVKHERWYLWNANRFLHRLKYKSKKFWKPSQYSCAFAMSSHNCHSNVGVGLCITKLSSEKSLRLLYCVYLNLDLHSTMSRRSIFWSLISICNPWSELDSISSWGNLVS